MLNKKTIDDIRSRYGFDSICVENLHSTNEVGERKYRISFATSRESYNDFIGIKECAFSSTRMG